MKITRIVKSLIRSRAPREGVTVEINDHGCILVGTYGDSRFDYGVLKKSIYRYGRRADRCLDSALDAV